mmetsp:Transcript_14766/g.28056  ORF Transcript_14766/g.28056 Transcript_14766/m.28056 type:complete len:257 (-) Transcript_14766:284-1054(-)
MPNWMLSRLGWLTFFMVPWEVSQLSTVCFESSEDFLLTHQRSLSSSCGHTELRSKEATSFELWVIGSPFLLAFLLSRSDPGRLLLLGCLFFFVTFFEEPDLSRGNASPEVRCERLSFCTRGILFHSSVSRCSVFFSSTLRFGMLMARCVVPNSGLGTRSVGATGDISWLPDAVRAIDQPRSCLTHSSSPIIFDSISTTRSSCSRESLMSSLIEQKSRTKTPFFVFTSHIVPTTVVHVAGTYSSRPVTPVSLHNNAS